MFTIILPIAILISVIIIYREYLTTINNLKLNALPKWLAISIKALLHIVAFFIVVIGGIITALIFSTDNKKKKI
ncbi:MAG: hypothetical protein ACOVNY_00200 [Chitinophagaceae bacterium]